MLPLLPQRRRWLPRIQRSPDLVIGSSGGAGTSSGSASTSLPRGALMAVISSSLNPSRSKSMSSSFNSPKLNLEQVHIPFGDGGGLIVSDPVRAGLFGCEADGDVDRHLRQPELLGRLEPRVARDDDALFIDDDRLAEAELPQALGDGLDRALVLAGVLLVRRDGLDRTQFNVHGRSFRCR